MQKKGLALEIVAESITAQSKSKFTQAGIGRYLRAINDNVPDSASIRDNVSPARGNMLNKCFLDSLMRRRAI